MNRKWIWLDETRKEKRIKVSVLRSAIKDIKEDKVTKNARTILEISNPGLNIVDIHYNEIAFKSLVIPGARNKTKEGEPSIPKKSFLVALPKNAKNVTVKIIEKKEKLISDSILIIPTPETTHKKINLKK